jgi:hypothetical protein
MFPLTADPPFSRAIAGEQFSRMNPAVVCGRPALSTYGGDCRYRAARIARRTTCRGRLEAGDRVRVSLAPTAIGLLEAYYWRCLEEAELRCLLPLKPCGSPPAETPMYVLNKHGGKIPLCRENPGCPLAEAFRPGRAGHRGGAHISSRR